MGNQLREPWGWSPAGQGKGAGTEIGGGKKNHQEIYCEIILDLENISTVSALASHESRRRRNQHRHALELVTFLIRRGCVTKRTSVIFHTSYK